MRLQFLLLPLMFLAGCASAPEPHDARFAPSYPAPSSPLLGTNVGAIYQPGTAIMFFQDNRAYRIGDTLTVLLTETTNASKSANTTTDKSNSTSIANPTLFGRQFATAQPKGLPLAAGDLSLGFELGSEHSFAGSGVSQQSNKLSGSITVTVAEVLPNGNLVVRGEKWLTLNQGDEYVRLSGIVRPVDIFADNSVPSTKIADARIEYGGKGAVADSNVMGWLSRFFQGRFWPF